MNNVEKIKAELKRIMEACHDENGNPITYGEDCAYARLSELEQFIDSLPDEHLSDDLERAADKEASDMWDKMEGEYDIAHDYFIAGANWQKEQLLDGDAIKEVKRSFGGEIKVDLFAKLDNGEYIDFYPSMEPAPACGVQIGNRVRIIVMED